ncbi:hypothetical protein MTBLM5_40125 [Magnetospirillum sp. LM-5]|nr:hypothetical protein MTBLM5_40125 [Magnetospirillum sp. LM-5]
MSRILFPEPNGTPTEKVHIPDNPHLAL